MFHRTMGGCAAIALLSAAGGAHAAERTPQVLQPSSKWNLDYSEDSCRLGRSFGEGANAMFMYLERFEPGDAFFMIVAGQPLGTARTRTTDIHFGPGGTDRKSAGFNAEFGTFGPAVMVNSVTLAPLPEWPKDAPPPTPAIAGATYGQWLTAEQERAVEWLDVRSTGRPAMRLALGPMDKPLAAMRQCTDELVTHWGLDLAALRGVTRPVAPDGNPGNWIISSDYPKAQLQSGQQGLVHFRLMVGADGKPQSCHIQQVTNPPEFGEAACKALMKRAKFTPALGAEGQPIASYWRTTVNFQMGW